jgi:hypothetical protein
VARLFPIFIVVSKSEKIQIRKDYPGLQRKICHQKAKLCDALHCARPLRHLAHGHFGVGCGLHITPGLLVIAPLL